MHHLKRVSITVFLASLLILISSSAFSFGGEGGYAGAYLRIGVGARPLGMGGAFTALSDDATASYWNAAGLGQLEARQIALMGNVTSMGRMLNLATYAHPMESLGTFGISWLNYGVYDIDGRDTLGNPTETFSDSENAFSISFGKSLSPNLSIGGSLKYFLHRLASKQATGYGVDIGVMAKIGKNIRIGGKIQDISSKIEWDTDSRLEEEFPTVTRLGISIVPQTTPIKISADIESSSEREARYHIGAEYWIIPSIAARAGYDSDHITAGGSAVFQISSVGLQLDYAFAPDELQQWPTHRMSITVRF